MRFVAVILIVVAAALPAAALADSHNPGGSSSIQQYVEQIPTSSGSAPLHHGGAATPLPKKEANAIRSKGGSDSTILGSIASSSTHRTPVKPQPKTRPSRLPRRAVRAPAVTKSGDGTMSLAWVLSGLVVVTFGGGVAAALRRR